MILSTTGRWWAPVEESWVRCVRVCFGGGSDCGVAAAFVRRRRSCTVRHGGVTLSAGCVAFVVGFNAARTSQSVVVVILDDVQ